ncbi:hypothetical protein ACFPVX_01330 [Cohnella faecalis]|uniref:Uncharacterized protein n=1 Tax=Cohnella faecalis TaxID=2315694 RepID=A0A398CQ64_9BACL|nr:hypothetical protein [Cohnella faecalis]RIE04665.1 hypothetical protein D3H35_04025 [Cohnella faecalis]
MNLADMLCYADIEQLTRIADAYECDCSSHSKNELIQSILTAVQRRDALETRVGQMSKDDLRFLNSLLFETRATYSLEELKARAIGNAAGKEERASGSANSPMLSVPVKQALSPAGSRSRKKSASPELPPLEPDEIARLAITRFKRFGWLFNGISQQTRYLFQVPEDVKTRLCDTLERQFRTSLQITDEPPVYRDEQGLLADDLIRLLRYARDNDAPLTSEGILYKRQLGQLLELMSIGEQVPAKGGWRFGYGRRIRDYPERFSLLYDFAWYNGFIREEFERLVVTEEGHRAAEAKGTLDPAPLYRLWLRLYKGPIPNLLSLVQWVSRLGTEWVTVSSLREVLLPLIRPYYYDTPQDVLERRVLAMMVHLGLLRWGETEAREAVVRMTSQGRSIVKGTSLAFEDTIRMDGTGVDSS